MTKPFSKININKNLCKLSIYENINEIAKLKSYMSSKFGIFSSDYSSNLRNIIDLFFKT